MAHRRYRIIDVNTDGQVGCVLALADSLDEAEELADSFEDTSGAIDAVVEVYTERGWVMV